METDPVGEEGVDQATAAPKREHRSVYGGGTSNCRTLQFSDGPGCHCLG